MRRPVIDSGEARVLVYASRAGENVTAMQLIMACNNREKHMRNVLQREGRMVKRVDKVATPAGDIEIIAKWEVYGLKQTKHVRQANAGSKSS